MKKLFAIIFMGLLLSACIAPVIHMNNYIPQNYMKVDSAIKLGKFSYLPADLGLVTDNQVAAHLFIDTSLSEIVKKATALELIQSGVKLEKGVLTLDGQIKQFNLRIINFSTGWIYIINYKITNSKTNRIILDKDYTITMEAEHNSLSEIDDSINKIIALGFEKFINDNDVRKVLEQK